MRFALFIYALGIDAILCKMHCLVMITAADIQKARAAANESQATFGARFGVDQSTIHRWETEGPPFRPLVQAGIAAVLTALANALTVDPPTAPENDNPPVQITTAEMAE